MSDAEAMDVSAEAPNDLLEMVTSVSNLARRYIERQIVRGEFRPGEKIKEAHIANALSISRSPVREAISSLESKGLVVQRPRRGAVVSPIDAAYILEIYTLQSQFYIAGLTLAWNWITESDLDELDEHVRLMEAIAASSCPDIERYQELNHSFHLVPIVRSGFLRLLGHANDYHVHVKRLSYVNITQETAHLSRSAEFHNRILEAIRARDLEASRALLQEHVLTAIEPLLVRYGGRGSSGDEPTLPGHAQPRPGSKAEHNGATKQLSNTEELS